MSAVQAILPSRRLEAAWNDHLAFAAHMGRDLSPGQRLRNGKVGLQPPPANRSINPVNLCSADRAAVLAYQTCFALFIQTQLQGMNQRAVLQRRIRNQASQSSCTSRGRDELSICTEASRTGEIADMFVRPAGNETLFIKIVRGRCNFRVITGFPQVLPEPLADGLNQAVGDLISHSP